jgi:hypothetical protein
MGNDSGIIGRFQGIPKDVFRISRKHFYRSPSATMSDASERLAV